jgi:hypothetical protein
MTEAAEHRAERSGEDLVEAVIDFTGLTNVGDRREGPAKSLEGSGGVGGWIGGHQQPDSHQKN